MKHIIIVIVILSLTLTACDKKSKHKMDNLPLDSKILVLGDSLTFGLGANSGEDWPSRLSSISNWDVTNAGINGDTSSGALARLPNLLAQNNYQAILIGIGGNDMLRNVSSSTTQANIEQIIQIALQHTKYVALIATPSPDPMRAAVGMLKDSAVYAQIAKEQNILLIDGVYAKVLSDSSLKSDAIHANAKGYAVIAEQISKQLKQAGWLK